MFSTAIYVKKVQLVYTTFGVYLGIGSIKPLEECVLPPRHLTDVAVPMYTSG